MTVRVLCIGRLKKPYLEAAQQEYEKLLSRYCRLEIVELKEEAPRGSGSKAEAAARQTEAERLAARLEGYVICLDPRGRQMDSERFSEMLDGLQQSGRNVTFVIGGSTGLAPSVKDKADLVLSMSEMTMPHHLFRIVLLEQIYRAFRIARGETYHK